MHVVIASCRSVASVASFGNARGQDVENVAMRSERFEIARCNEKAAVVVL